ncbi:MAG TPA: SRPBCC family protein [Burkholderiales bacterium]|nr:SRPBCC family protein [Burkholderiales bacterium]
MKIERSFPISAPAAAAWKFLQDIRAVAECMPGARITEQIDATHYKGQVSVKLGPASAQFAGELEIRGVDPAKREIRLFGKGAEAKGSSAATMDLTAGIRESEGGCELAGVSEVGVSGKLAGFGGRMMTQVSDQILKQFADNFASRVAATAEAAPPAEPRQLNALALIWGVIAGWFRSVFGHHAKPPT